MNKEQNSNSRSDNDFNRELAQFDKLLHRGLDELSDIEIEEFTKGLSSDELQAKLQKSVKASVERSVYSKVNNINGLIFEEDIQYIIENEISDVDDIPVETIEKLLTIPPETTIAVYKKEGSDRQSVESLLRSYDEEYRNRAGIAIRSEENDLVFFSTRSGKVVLYKNRIYLMASDKDAACNVKISSDGMEAYINCFPAIGNGNKLKFSLILTEIENAGVVMGIDKAVIDKTLEKVNSSGLSALDVQVAWGIEPCNGKDSEITYHFNNELPEIGFTILPDGKIDYKKQAPIKIVYKDNLLLSVSDPEPGTDGFKVTGEVLKAEPGIKREIFEGENVRRDDTGNRFFANCNGVVCLHQNVLNVYPHYQVDGNVDMHSGNINFNGSVIVLGNVNSGFGVRAAGDIFIAGCAEGATLEAGRDIRVNGAIVGSNGTSVKSGRNIFAGHVQNAFLEAENDIVIVRSAMHSQIYTTGRVFLHDIKGSIIGGMINAMKGIETVSIGSVAGTQTELIAGSDYLVRRKINELREIVKFHESNQMKIDTVLKPLMAIVKKGIPLGSDKKRRLASIVEKRSSITKQLNIVNSRLSELSDVNPEYASVTITVKKTLYQNVTIRISDAVLRTNESLKGVTCRLSPDHKKILLSSRERVPGKTAATRSFV